MPNTERPRGMICDLGDWIETSYGPEGRVIGFSDRPHYVLERADGSHVSVVDTTVKTVTPAPPLPDKPGFYIGDHRDSPSGRLIVELLNSPEGQWVNADDSNYLDSWYVSGMRNLKRLVETYIEPASSTLNEGTPT